MYGLIFRFPGPIPKEIKFEYAQHFLLQDGYYEISCDSMSIMARLITWHIKEYDIYEGQGAE